MRETRDNGTCLRRFRHNIRNYTLNLALKVTAYTMLWAGLAVAVTSIERRYSFSSYKIGVIFCASDIGRVAMLLLVSHFGNRYSTPKIVAITGVCNALSHIVLALPHFVFSPTPTDSLSATGDQTNFGNRSNLSIAGFATPDPIKRTTSEDMTGSTKAHIMMVVAMVMIGMSDSADISLGLTYIDDNAEEGTAPLYMGIVECGFSLGPLIGALIGSYFLTLYVDLSETSLTPADPAWVGAWWLMVLTTSLCILVTAPSLACFPRRIKPSSNHEISPTDGHDIAVAPSEEQEMLPALNHGNDGDTGTKGSERLTHPTYTAKDLPVALWRIIKNPLFLCLTGFAGARDFAGMGYRAYGPKYLENVFNITAWNASLYSGLACVVDFFALFTAISLMKKLNLSYVGVAKMLVISSVGAMACNLAMMFVWCDGPTLAGDISAHGESLSPLPCGHFSGCSLEVYQPLCDVTQDLTYFSPCYAGCPEDVKFPLNETKEKDRVSDVDR